MGEENTTESGNSIASKGGIARRNALTPEERSEIARNAVQARWEKAGKHAIPRATHTGELNIGSASIQCAVLENGKRVLTQRGMFVALGRNKNPTTGYSSTIDSRPGFLAAANLNEFIPEDLKRSWKPIPFHLPKGPGGFKGNIAFGYDAMILPMVCNVFVDAKIAGKTTKHQEHIVSQCRVLLKALAGVAIIALVDEATGYQYERPRRDLEEYLKKFLSEGLVRWARTFPNDYFKHLCRLKGIELRPDMRLPQYFGHLTNDLVYRRIAPGLLRALKERRVERGRPSNKLHWWTSEELGHPELLLHLGTVVGLMKIHTDYDKFHSQLDAVAPVFPEYPGLFDNPADWEPRMIHG